MKKFFNFVLFTAFFIICFGILIANGSKAHAYKLKKGGYWKDSEKGSISVMGGKFTIPFNKTFFTCQNNNTHPYIPPVKLHCKFSEHYIGNNTIGYSMVCKNPKGTTKSNGVTKILSPDKFISKIKTVFTSTSGHSSVTNFTIKGHRLGDTCK